MPSAALHRVEPVRTSHPCHSWPASAGRWKATTVAVKIIEHYGVDAEASTGSRRVSAGREMLFATSISHPNGKRYADSASS